MGHFEVLLHIILTGVSELKELILMEQLRPETMLVATAERESGEWIILAYYL